MNYREGEFFLKKGLVVQRVIARDGSGVVYCVYSERDQTKYSMKKFPLANFSDKDLDHLASINNEHIVRIFQHYSFEGNVYILTEYCPSNLEKFIKSKEEMSNDLLRKYINDVVLAVKTCHDNQISIGDFTLSNFMIDMTGKIKINIIGLRMIEQYQSETAPPAFQSMNYFLPPEVLESNNFNPLAADMWSLGCIIYFMATKTLPFNSKDMKFLKEQIKSAEYNNSIIMDNNLKDVISRCLKFDPASRFSINNLLKMRYFNSYEGKLNTKAYRIKADWRKSVLVFRRSTTINERKNSQIDTPMTPLRPLISGF